jgi:hypothetical protein
MEHFLTSTSLSVWIFPLCEPLSFSNAISVPLTIRVGDRLFDCAFELGELFVDEREVNALIAPRSMRMCDRLSA